MNPVYDAGGVQIFQGDCRTVFATLPAESVQTCVTSPPYYGLRRYAGLPDSVWGGEATCEHEWGSTDTSVYDERTRIGLHKDRPGVKDYEKYGQREATNGRLCRHCNAWLGQLGNEPTVALYLAHLLDVFRAVRRVLRPDGTCWVNLGDAYATSPNGRSADEIKRLKADDRTFRDKPFDTSKIGIPAKNLLLVPERFAIAAQSDGWYVRSRIVWAKTSAMPESVQDRPTSAHETIWLLAKGPRYFYDAEAVKQPIAESMQDRRHLGVREATPRNQTYFEQGIHGYSEGLAVYNRANANLRNVWLDTRDAPLDDLWVLGPEPYKDAHFATFPTAIPKRAILAGTSERGQCAQCGAPWRRVTETKYERLRGNSVIHGAKGSDGQNGWSGYPILGKQSETVGWQPSCSHAAPVEPQVVLDPFLGSGTTAAVARSLGRRCIGIEASAEYVKLAIKRIDAVPLHLSAVTVDEAKPEQLTLMEA